MININFNFSINNYKNSVSNIILNGSSRNNGNLLPSELTQGNYGILNDYRVILFAPT